MPTIRDQHDKLKQLKRELEAGGEMNGIGSSFTITGAEISGDGTSWIEVMPTAVEARNGNAFFTITKEDLGLLVADIQAKPDRVPVDYDHAGVEKGDSRAAGWFTGEAVLVTSGGKGPTGEAQDRDSVWAKVKWTPKAVQEIRDGEFRFVSAEWEMTNKDPKSGLWTQFKEIAASTLTNRPFFTDLAPVMAKANLERVTELASTIKGATVSADGQTVTFDPDDVVVLNALDDLLDEILGEPESEDAAQARDLAIHDTLKAAVWTTAYINNLPDSSFLYIEAGGSKDSTGRTEPRSLRHFPVKDASGSPDMAHVRNALARIPQSNVPASAKASATTACQRMLRDMGGNPSATDQGTTDDPKEIIVADDQPVTTDYMKMLGLDDTVDPKHRLAAAFRDKDEKILALEQERTDLVAKLQEADKLNDRVAELEQRDRTRDIEVILTRAVEKGRVLPAEKETLAEVFASDVNGLQRMIATRPSEMFVQEKPKGVSGDADRFIDDPEVTKYVRAMNTGGDPVDTEQAKQHLAAMQLLKDEGKSDNYTNDEYVAAYERASSLIY